ncbi:MAG TPA: thioredoxin domain-containing protein [Solirubrobacteraceae bacterium]|nr:thioredoxin domain-containing protein [Solirubrobacteraceae bacterium]
MPPADPHAHTRRRYQLGALLTTAALIAAVLTTVLGGSSPSSLAPGRPVPGAPTTLALLRSIPQHRTALGSPAAPVTLVELGDLQCPTCANFAHGALPAIVSHYVRPGRLLLVLRPLTFIGPDSLRAARMALALGLQNHLWEFTELMYLNQGLENSGYVTERYLRALAAAIPRADTRRALADRSLPFVQSQLAQANTLAKRFRVNATPAFLLYRSTAPARVFTPASLDFRSFATAIDRLLASHD